ncbi:oligopeptide:H+ symporter [Candidatus Riesia pediculischaeffi]|uniref:Peptide ABC transporter permease n=1 Tax=Candidatus Riesia pediculischaeffi TaxID=428411 RepID=A0A1V0HJZ5_9ENTR|nr:oligopeptide:H+ symporter [Candidatus Riesia pediculischaeffi]ARC53156.1 peptide ABC transporter permease [Candidatus Riesia pediculischaeffi]
MSLKDNICNFNLLKQPKPFYLIFSIELWERFSFYGLQGILTIYLTKILNMSEDAAFSLFSAFIALVYGFVAVGGWIGDKILGSKRVIILGTLTLILGYSLIAFSKNKIFLIYFGLSCISVGNGLFKSNPSSLLSSCYDKKDARLDGAFTMYYMSINIGSFLSMLTTPVLAKIYGWNIAFSLSVFGLLVTLLVFLSFKGLIKNIGSYPDFQSISSKTYFFTISGIIVLILISNWLLYNLKVIKIVLMILSMIIVIKFIQETVLMKRSDRLKMLIISILTIEALIFFVLYGQMPMSINFFAAHNVKNTIFGFPIESAQYQSLNPFWIIIFSPILSRIYDKTGKYLMISYKFAIGMIFCSISFLILPIGSIFSECGIVSPLWLIFSYASQGIGELMISGLGLSMIAQFSPRRLMGFIMGIWFLTNSVSSFISGYISSLTAFPEGIVTDPIESLKVYDSVFTKIGIISLIISIIMLYTAPYLNRIILLKTQDKQ